MSKLSSALVSTPQKAVSALIPNSSKPSTPAQETFPPSPGTFRHPRLTEIIARQSASSFSSRNLQNASVNFGALALTFALSDPIHNTITIILAAASVGPSTIDATWPISLVRLYFLINIIVSLRPILPYISKHDEVTDIPLTPSQRVLLGLNPSAPPTPTSTSGAGNFITPPRYRHTSGSANSTPNSQQNPSTDRRSISANYSASPLSTSRHTLGFSPSPQNRRASGSPFSPSPMANTAQRSQYQSNEFDAGRSTATSTLGRSQSLRDRERRGSTPFADSIGSMPGTPSPSSRARVAMPGLNYKWLYEKGGRIGGLGKNENMGY